MYRKPKLIELMFRTNDEVNLYEDEREITLKDLERSENFPH